MNFKKFLSEQRLDEKLIVFGGGKKYGQIVFLAGGAGSGKDFAIANFMENEKYTVVDPDKLMEIFLKFERVRGGRFKDIDLKDPDQVTKAWDYVKNEKGWKYKKMDLIFKDLKAGILPNIIFNTTLSWPQTLTEYADKMEKLGYDKQDMHLVWVLSDYKVALERNKARDRVVDVNVLLGTHIGAANNLHSLLIKSKNALPVDGGVYVILNNKENTIYWDTKEKTKMVVKDFTYLTVKKPGKPMEDNEQVTTQLVKWIRENVPQTDETKELFEGIKSSLKKQFGRQLSPKIVKPNKFQVVHNFPVKGVKGLSVDIISDISDVYAEVVFKKNGKPFLSQHNVEATDPPRWVAKLEKDKPFIDYLKEVMNKI